MTTLAQRPSPIKNGFDALFGQNDIFSTEIVLWPFLAQTLRDGKGVACTIPWRTLQRTCCKPVSLPPPGTRAITVAPG